MIDLLKRLVYQAWVWARMQLTERRRWWGLGNEDYRPRVYYGHEHVPGPHETAAGGIIKCHDLSQVFPNTLRGGNLLYLVSSALPAMPERVVSYAKRAGVKFVLNQNGVACPAYHGDRCEIINGPRRVILKTADSVVYQSEFCKRFADHFLGPCSCHWRILHNPVDTTIFCPVATKHPGHPPVLLLAGSHHFRYRVTAAIAAIAVLKQRGTKVHLVIAGRLKWLADEAECLSDLRGICRGHQVSDDVSYRGSYSQIAAPALMNEADILLHTKYLDPCPRLVVEAMACGLPTVYSASGGVPELVGCEAGVGIETFDDYDHVHPPGADAIADGVETILASYSQYSQAARDRAVDRFDLKPWLRSHREIFEGLLS